MISYSEEGNAITIHYDSFEDAWPELIWAVDQGTLIESYNGGCSDTLSLTPPVDVQLADGADGAPASTTAQTASTLNGSTQVTATGGGGATAAAEPSFNLLGGADGSVRLTLTRDNDLWPV